LFGWATGAGHCKNVVLSQNALVTMVSLAQGCVNLPQRGDYDAKKETVNSD